MGKFIILMLHKTFCCALFILYLPLLVACSSGDSQGYVAGEDYLVLQAESGDLSADLRPEVLEFFWYGCRHCYRLEPYLSDWLAHSKPTAVHFVRIPAVFNDASRLHARLFYTATQFGNTQAIHAAIFDAVHRDGRRLATPNAVAAFIAEQAGVSLARAKSTLLSPQISAKVEEAERLTRQYRLTAVPTFIVNRHYLISGKTAGGVEDMLPIVGQLLAGGSGETRASGAVKQDPP